MKTPSRPPDELVGRPGAHHFRRWWLVRTRLLSVYLHEVVGDDPQDLHDHRSWNVSVILRGEYREVVVVPFYLNGWRYLREVYGLTETHPRYSVANAKEGDRPLPTVTLTRRAGDIVFRRADTPHRVMRGAEPALTLFITGPDLTLWGRRLLGRRWGFHEPTGWTHWRAYVARHGGRPL